MLARLHHSVRYKIMAAILVTTLAALFVSALASLAYQSQNYRRLIVADAITQADLLAKTITPALEAHDPHEATNTFSFLATRTSIIAVAVYTPAGQIFAQYLRSGTTKPIPAIDPAAATVIHGGQVELFRPIATNGKRIGTLYLRLSHHLGSQISGYLWILAAIMAFSFAVAAAISLRLQRSVSAPVLAITDVAREVVQHRDFSVRARKVTDDEIGVLVDSFNTMLAEVGSMTDALRATNRHLQQETDERRRAEGALRIANQRKDEFLATLAHELRNPLAPMVNALNLIKARKHATGSKDRAEDIMARQLGHLVRLVEDLLDVSRITLGKLAIKPAPVEFATVVTSAVDTVQPMMTRKQHHLEVKLPAAPIYLYADPVRLSQILSNLLNNAAKYTDPGGHVTLTATTDDEHLTIRVKDDGIGIVPDELGTVFQMFAQVGGSLERSQGGLGVGLALARQLVELHGGSLEVASSGLGLGTEFILVFPTIEAPQPAKTPALLPPLVASEEYAVEAEYPPLHILVVDDNRDFTASLATLLAAHGYTVTTAESADGALAAAAKGHTDIALLDIGLPGMSGYELAARLQELPASAPTTLIALSGWGQPKDRQRSKEAGFAAHLVKPVAIEDILAALRATTRAPATG